MLSYTLFGDLTWLDGRKDLVLLSRMQRTAHCVFVAIPKDAVVLPVSEGVLHRTKPGHRQKLDLGCPRRRRLAGWWAVPSMDAARS